MSLWNELYSLGLPAGEYVVVGSAGLEARGILTNTGKFRKASDIDLLVSVACFELLRHRGWHESIVVQHCIARSRLAHMGAILEAEAFDDFYFQGVECDTDLLIRRAEVINGIAFLPLRTLRAVKLDRGLPKDLADVERIDEDPRGVARKYG